MKRDGGWIHTLLEEAENERMHLLVFMNMFSPGIVTRAAVIGMQYLIVAVLLSIYVVRPQVVHRFVGYLEETAVQTYLSVIKQMEDPTTRVHKEWSELPAPEIAITYWKMPEDAKFIDVIKQIAADEMHHRDVNHEFADLNQHDFNPHVHTHIHDADRAAKLRKATQPKHYGTANA
ncbi:Alternative oxidase [Diplonema papillatum]|nr:Alternative oxidase [Diplonema papillatum]